MQPLKRYTPTAAIAVVKEQMTDLLEASGFKAQDQPEGTDDPAVVWTHTVGFGLAVIAVVAWAAPGPGYRRTILQLRFGFKDSELGRVFYSDWCEHQISVPDYGTSMDVVRRASSRTPMQRHRQGLEAGLYDGSSSAEMEASLAAIGADLIDVVFPFFARFPTRQSILEYLLECRRQRCAPIFFPAMEVKYLALQAMYGHRESAVAAIQSKARSLRRWRRFYQLIGLDKTKEEQDSIKWLDRMKEFLATWSP